MLPVLLPPKSIVQIVKLNSGEDIQILPALRPELKSKPPFNPERTSSVHIQYHNLGSNARIFTQKLVDLDEKYISCREKIANNRVWSGIIVIKPHPWDELV